MKVDDYFLLLLNCKEYSSIRNYFENIIEISNRAKIVSYDYGYEQIINRDENYTSFLMKLIDSYINNNFVKEPGVYFLELYKNSKVIIQFDAETQMIYFSDDYEKALIENLYSIMCLDTGLNIILDRTMDLTSEKLKKAIKSIDDFNEYLINNSSSPALYEKFCECYHQEDLSFLGDLGKNIFKETNYNEIVRYNMIVRLVLDLYEKKLFNI